MAWHDEPPRDDRVADKTTQKSDIWNRPRKKSTAPPDLEAALLKLKKQLADMFSGKNRPNMFGKPASPTGSSGVSQSKQSNILVGLLLLLFIGIWGIAGIFIVGPAEQAVVLQFGKYKDTVGPGPHWIPLFINSKQVVNVDKISDYSYSAKMLTKDENIVSVSVAIQYRIGNLEDYLFNAADPQESLQQATASALRQVVGHSTLSEIIAEGREVWGHNVETLLNRILDSYQVGIVITSVSPQPARAPEEVQDAFDDAINAQEDEKRFKEQAYAYSASVVPIAEGNAKRIMTGALAYEKQVILHAQGETAAFLDLLPEYLRSPNLMNERLYLEMMEEVLTKTTKVIVSDSNKNLLYLPLESLLTQASQEKTSESLSETANKNSLNALTADNYIGRSDVREERRN